MEIGPSSSSYIVKISVIHHHTRKSCAKTWRFAYGISDITHKRATGRRKNSRKKNNNKKYLRNISDLCQKRTRPKQQEMLGIPCIFEPFRIPRLNSSIKLPA